MSPVSVFDDRRKMFAWVHLASAFTLTLFIAVHLSAGCCYALSAVEGLLALVMLGSYLAIRRGAALASVEDVLMASAVLLFSALVFFQSVHDTGVFWIAGFPFVAYFVQRVQRARYWVAFFAAEILVAAWMQSHYLFQTPYSVTQLLCLDAVVLFFWLFAHIYQSQLESRNRQLETSYQQLGKQQARLQAILDHSPIGIWMIDDSRHLQFLNKAWERWSGISEQDALLTNDYSTLLPEPFAAKALASDHACFNGDGSCYSREQIPCDDGELRTLDIIRVRLVDSSGKASGLVGFAIDVSQQVKAEAEQLLLEQQMQHAQRLESLGVLAGGIAHDFNNLLTAINGSVALMRLEENIPDAIGSSINCIDSATQAATELCQQMLAYSGKGLQRTELFDVREMIESMQSLLEASIGKHVSLRCNFASIAGAIEADRAQFRQLLLNLIVNASEAIEPAQTGKIDLSVARRNFEDRHQQRFLGVEPDTGNYVVISIRDNGSGMDAELIDRMFEPFFTTKFTGRGLGLSAILGILRAHKAAIAVDSQPGAGTTIEVWFPAVADLPVAAVPPEIESSVSRPQRGRVLLVDDEPGVLDVAGRMLAKIGLEVETAVNGREALTRFAEDSGFDWVMLDVTMPEMDGNACLKAMREIRPDLYVVMTSGYTADNALTLDGDCQPDDFLTKPFSFDALRSAAQRAMESHA